MTCRYGAECLFRMYSYGMEREYRASLFNDFQQLTLRDLREGRLYALEKLWALFQFARGDARPPLSALTPELSQLLVHKYRTLRDFRIQVSD